ncbi:MAG: hypothetical protein AAF318_17235 [Pseudomonadota bacterium]
MAFWRTLSLMLAGGLFVLFFGNVLMGALRRGEFLSDIVQVVMLFAACVLFVIGVLIREAEVNAERSGEQSQ